MSIIIGLIAYLVMAAAIWPLNVKRFTIAMVMLFVIIYTLIPR